MWCGCWTYCLGLEALDEDAVEEGLDGADRLECSGLGGGEVVVSADCRLAGIRGACTTGGQVALLIAEEALVICAPCHRPVDPTHHREGVVAGRREKSVWHCGESEMNC